MLSAYNLLDGLPISNSHCLEISLPVTAYSISATEDDQPQIEATHIAESSATLMKVVLAEVTVGDCGTGKRPVAFDVLKSLRMLLSFLSPCCVAKEINKSNLLRLGSIVISTVGWIPVVPSGTFISSSSPAWCASCALQ